MFIFHSHSCFLDAPKIDGPKCHMMRTIADDVTFSSGFGITNWFKRKEEENRERGEAEHNFPSQNCDLQLSCMFH